MIFVTVGTHEQQFNRLLKEVDRLKGEGVIKDDVFMQTGFSDYKPQHCQWKSLISYDEMSRYMDEADIVITHGGPATFMSVFANKKTPIVVPRKKQYEEHVNDHQLEFAYKLRERYAYFPIIDDINKLGEAISQTGETSQFSSHNQEFCQSLADIVEGL